MLGYGIHPPNPTYKPSNTIVLFARALVPVVVEDVNLSDANILAFHCC